jgi:copper homeostasis protein
LIPKQSLIQTTFHRAFDVTSDWKQSLETIKTLGFDRLLTSGQEKSAYEGRYLIKKCVELSNRDNMKPLIILPGAGITNDNLKEILSVTGCREFHASCKSIRQSQMEFRNNKISMGSPLINEFSINTADINRVKELANIFNKFILG